MMEIFGISKSLIDLLRGQIIRGELAPGAKLNEVQMASDLGISRSPLREALRVLENERLVVSIPRRGTFVTDVSHKDLGEIYQMREMIECYTIELLRKKNTRELPLVTPYIEHVGDMVIPSEKDSAQNKMAYIEALAQFHLKLVESSGNNRLFGFYQMIHSNINRYVFLNAFLEGVAEHRVKEHYQAFTSIKQGKYKKAQEIIRGHIRFSCEQLIKRMKNQETSQSHLLHNKTTHGGSIRHGFRGKKRRR